MFCPICKNDKPPVEFYDGMKCRCKECHKARMKMLRLTNPEWQERDRARAKHPSRKQKSTENTRKWRTQHPEAYRAQNALNNAIRDGHIKRGPCEICGTAEHVHAHHQDYKRPLDVNWLCAKCHHRIHSVFPRLGGHYEARK